MTFLGVLSVELFAITFSGSWSIVVRLYSSEIQPFRTRASATAFGQGANQAVNFVVAVTGPAFLAESSFGEFYCFILSEPDVLRFEQLVPNSFEAPV